VFDRCPIDPDPVSFCKILKILACEVGSVVGDDGIGHAKPVDDVQEKLDSFLGINRSDWFCLYPFGELVDCDKKVGEPS
jgi:hypothetical protein